MSCLGRSDAHFPWRVPPRPLLAEVPAARVRQALKGAGSGEAETDTNVQVPANHRTEGERGIILNPAQEYVPDTPAASSKCKDV